MEPFTPPMIIPFQKYASQVNMLHVLLFYYNYKHNKALMRNLLKYLYCSKLLHLPVLFQ